MNPAGIDPNFFYGEYLIDRDRPYDGRQKIRALLEKLTRDKRAHTGG